MPSRERTPQERETLIFPNKEQAQAFGERVAEQVKANERPGVSRRREVVAEAVAEVFDQAGHPAGLVTKPWEHTPAEHEEVQRLVNLAFARDLGTALKEAKHSPHYPRVLDLLHDVLTGEMYDLVLEQRLNRQPAGVWLIFLFGLAGGLLLLVTLVLALATTV